MADKKPKGISRLVLVMGIIIAVLAISNAYLLFPRETAPSSKPAQAPQTLQKFRATVYSLEGPTYFLVIDGANERGIWAKHGIEPEFVSKPGRPIEAADIKEYVESGIKIGATAANDVLLARANGVPIKIVAGHLGEVRSVNVYGKSDSAIRDVNDLDGKKIGVLSPTAWNARFVLAMSKKFAIKPEAVPLGNLTNMVVALKLGRVDAFVASEISALRLVDSGELRIILKGHDVIPRPYVGAVVYATEDLIAQNPDLVRRFVKAWLESVSYLKDNPGYAAEIYMKKTNAPRDVATRAVAFIDWRPDGRGSGGDLMVAVANSWNYIKESGAIPANVNVKIEDAVDVRFLP